jgi:hypothetical protein
MRERVKLLLPAGIIAILLLLAIGINSLQMLPGRPFYLGDIGAMSVGGNALATDPNNISMTVFRIMMLAAAILLPLTILLALLSRDGRRQMLAYIILGAGLVLIFTLLQSSAQPARDTTVTKPNVVKESETPQATRLPTDVFSPTAPDWLVLAISVGVGLALGAIVTAVIYLAWRRRHKKGAALQELAAGAQNAIQSLQAGAELKDVVLRCYRDMSSVLQKERGIQRQAAMTAREFESSLQNLGIPAEPVQQLTRLFEQVRYGHTSVGAAEEQQAIISLKAIMAACQPALMGNASST